MAGGKNKATEQGSRTETTTSNIQAQTQMWGTGWGKPG